MALPRDFLLFNFSNDEDVSKVLELGQCFFGRNGLVLKRRHKGYRADVENINLVPVWVYLPNLPIEFCNINMLIRIANGIDSLVSIKKVTKVESMMMNA